MSYNTVTQTATYTVVDVRKTFENFEADLRMIATRTGKWDAATVDKVVYDVLQLAEAYYLQRADIILLDAAGNPVRAASYTVNESGSAPTGARAGNNPWPNQAGTTLTVLLSYTPKWHNLLPVQQQAFERGLKNSWSAAAIDNSYPGLQSENAQLYASKGYELTKRNFS